MVEVYYGAPSWVKVPGVRVVEGVTWCLGVEEGHTRSDRAGRMMPSWDTRRPWDQVPVRLGGEEEEEEEEEARSEVR